MQCQQQQLTTHQIAAAAAEAIATTLVVSVVNGFLLNTTPRAVAGWQTVSRSNRNSYIDVAHLSIENCLRIYKIRVIDLLMLSKARRL